MSEQCEGCGKNIPDGEQVFDTGDATLCYGCYLEAHPEEAPSSGMFGDPDAFPESR